MSAQRFRKKPVEDAMSDAETIIADVLGRHRIEQGMRIGKGERIEWWECLECGWTSGEHEIRTNLESLKRAHLAAEVNKALGTLSREFGARMSGDTEITVVTEGTARYQPAPADVDGADPLRHRLDRGDPVTLPVVTALTQPPATVLADVLNLHTACDCGWCHECGQKHPCKTRRLIEGAT